MLRTLKAKFYFPVASYFKLFASLQLTLWRPQIIVVTGSSGKTTLLNMIESQLGTKARYSHQANSSFGIPFDILGLHREQLELYEWIWLFLLAPFYAFKKPYPQKIYVVEADCDRPGEGEFLATLLKPEVTLWINSGQTHSANFDQLVANKKFTSVEQAIAFEFGFFIEATKSLVVVSADSTPILSQLNRTNAQIAQVSLKKQLRKYTIHKTSTEFLVDNQVFRFPYLLTKGNSYGVIMTQKLMEYLGVPLRATFPRFKLPPGRSSLLKGIKSTTIIDSTYNATLEGMSTILEMFEDYPAKKKWAVLGDMIEQGQEEREAHQKLAQILNKMQLEKIVLMGPRVSQYTYPMLKSKNVVTFEKPKEALDYLQSDISGGETILFKGARFMEGIIEHLLADKKDTTLLCRRESVWQKYRKAWEL